MTLEHITDAETRTLAAELIELGAASEVRMPAERDRWLWDVRVKLSTGVWQGLKLGELRALVAWERDARGLGQVS